VAVPKSRYVSATSLKPLLVYLVGAVIVLVGVDVTVRALRLPAYLLTLGVLVWIVALPWGGWIVWKRGERGAGGAS